MTATPDRFWTKKDSRQGPPLFVSFSGYFGRRSHARGQIWTLRAAFIFPRAQAGIRFGLPIQIFARLTIQFEVFHGAKRIWIAAT
jgi:hypothetical protein